MFLNFEKLQKQIPVIEQEEKKAHALEEDYDRILEATTLSDVEKLSIETLALAMLHMPEYVLAERQALNAVSKIIDHSIKLERVRVARLL